MRTNAAGLSLIKTSERLMLKAYKPTPDDVWTIGYGHTRDVKEGQVISAHQAEIIFQSDVEGVESEVAHLTAGLGLNENQFSALVSFTLNLGAGALSTMLSHGRDQIAAQFEKWIHQGSKVLPGLVTRRAAEKALFEKVSA